MERSGWHSFTIVRLAGLFCRVERELGIPATGIQSRAAVAPKYDLTARMVQHEAYEAFGRGEEYLNALYDDLNVCKENTGFNSSFNWGRHSATGMRWLQSWGNKGLQAEWS